MVLLSADSWSWSSDWFLGGMTSSQLLTSCMFWFTSHTLPEFTSLRTTRSRFTRNTYDGDALALGTSTVLSSASFDAVTDILVRPRPRRMHTPAQLHRRRRHTLPAKRHRLRRRTIQRLLQQRLRRRHRHRIRRRTRLLQLRIPRLRQRQLTPARQEQLPPARIQHHRLVPHHRQLQIPGTLQARPRYSTVDIRRPHPRHPPTSPSPARTSDPHCKSGHQHPPPTPSLPNPPTPAREFSSSKPFTVDGDNAHTVPFAASVTAMTSDPKLTSADPGNFLSPPNRMLRRRHLVQRRTRTVIHKHRPGILQHIKRRHAGVTAPSNTRDG